MFKDLNGIKGSSQTEEFNECSTFTLFLLTNPMV